ncbi:MAG: Ig-like domain-containing protein [Planctomycetes bacterium]|nr:Ig-like domain-containing protein [Planctomycetota bacterium]
MNARGEKPSWMLLLFVAGVATAAHGLLVSPGPRVSASDADKPAGPRLRHVLADESSELSRVELAGLPAEAIEALRNAKLSSDQWRRLFSVTIDGRKSPLSMLGDYSIAEGNVRFLPRFPLKAGAQYRATFDSSQVDIAGLADVSPLELEFKTPALPEAPPTRIAAVYPTGDVQPENLLKFYIHFSAPMTSGQAYRNVRLLDSEGREVVFPFLELGEELWDPSFQRFTLFFDPGRIKRGLKPRELFGPALIEGGKYTFEVEAAWEDARGRPLKESFKKTFKVAAPDDRQPDHRRWKLLTPAAGTTQPLAVIFEEPLDHAMLQRVLKVVDAGDAKIAGTIEVDRGETRWQFRPDHSWQPGRYRLIADNTLEDRAGNSLGRPFEVDIQHPITRKVEKTHVAMPFDVRPAE